MAAAHAAAAAAGVPLYRYLGGHEAALLPLPQIQIFGGGAHAGRRVDIQDFMVVCPGAHELRARRWSGRPRSTARAGVLMHAARLACGRRRRRRLVAGLRHQRAGARDAGRRPSSGPASCPARRWPSRSTSPPPSSAAPAATRSGSSRASSTADGMIELLLRWIDKYPIVLDRGPAGRGRPRGLRALHAGRGSRLQIVGDDLLVSQCAAGAPGRRRRRGQRGAAQAQPARHADRDAAGLAGGARARAMPASSRRARARPRTPRSCIWRSAGSVGPAQGRLVRARRAHGQVERGAAHRGAAGFARAVRRRRACSDATAPRVWDVDPCSRRHANVSRPHIAIVQVVTRYG